MKKILLLVLLAPALLRAQTNGLTLAQTRAMVLDANPSVRESAQRIAAAEAVLKQARSAYLPTVTMTGGYGHIDSSLHPDADPRTRYGESFLQATVGVEATWPLFDGFAREANALAAKYGVRQTREMADETRRLLVLAATTAFRQAQLAKEAVRIAERDHAFNADLEADARKRFEAGALPEADVHNFSIRVLQAESSALQARRDHAIACTVLAELMALPEAELPEGMRPVAITFGTDAQPRSVDDELRYALAHRPDYKALKTGELVLAQQVRAAKGDLFPKIAVVGGVNYDDNEGWSTIARHGAYDSYVGVGATWDLFTGGRKVNTVKQARAEMRALEEQREALRLSIRSSLRQRIEEAKTARSVFERQEKIHALTIQVRDSVKKSYQAGAASITRLNEAQTDLTRARGAYTTAFIAYQLTLNQLDIETGRVLEQF